MSENAQIPSAQNPAENPSKAFDTNPNWQSDFDAWSSIQYILKQLQNTPVQQTDAIQHELDCITNNCKIMSLTYALSTPFLGIKAPADAAKLIASIAEPLLVYPEPAMGDFPQFGIQYDLRAIIQCCKSIDPSSAS